MREKRTLGAREAAIRPSAQAVSGFSERKPIKPRGLLGGVKRCSAEESQLARCEGSSAEAKVSSLRGKGTQGAREEDSRCEGSGD